MNNKPFQFDDEEQIVEEGDQLAVEEFAKDVDNAKKEEGVEENENKKEIAQLGNVEVNVKFNFLVKFFSKMSQTRGKKKSELVNMVCEYFFKKNRNPKYTFTIMRLLIPFQDRNRGVYKLQEKALAKLFREALGLSDQDYTRMANYKNASSQPYGAPVGDFPMVVQSVIGDYCRKDPQISISDIDRLLQELADNPESKAQVQILIRIIQQCTSQEILWIVRLILKDLKIGLKYEKVLEYFHPDAVEYFNATSSLLEVCKEFEDANHSLKNVLRLFHPIKPMLAAKKGLDDIQKIFTGKKMLIETKFDGERIQCHFTPEQIRFFTRNSNDYTHIYKVKMGDIIRQCVNAHSAILDGEIIVLDRSTGQQIRFGMNKTVAQDVGDDTYQLCYKIFDLLYIKGHKGEEYNTMNIKLEDRKQILKRIIKPMPQQLELVEGTITDDLLELAKEFDNAIHRNEEGIIIKQLDTEYLPNERGTKWIKLKGDYIENLTDTCDLIVIGGYFGTQSHRVDQFDTDPFSRITHFLMGIAQKIDKNNPNQCMILPFTKVGTGFNDLQLSMIRQQLKPFWSIANTKYKPSFIPQNWNPGINDRPDVYIKDPSNSIIFEVKAAEITPSNTFPTDNTLRFPRCVNIRHDKSWYEMMTMQDLQQMINDSKYTKNMKKKKDSGGSQEESDDEVQGARPMRQAKQRKQPHKRGFDQSKTGIMRQFQGADPKTVAIETSLFGACEFLIANVEESDEYDKQYLETLIYQQGGTCVQNFILESVTHVIASVKDIRVKAIIEKYETTIIKPKWVFECIRRKQLLNIAPRFILYSSPSMKDAFKQYYDRFGDSFMEDVDEYALTDICNNINIANYQIDPREVDELTDYLLHDQKSIWILDSQSFFLYCNQQQIEEEELSILKIRLIARGAKLVDSFDQNMDYIVLFPGQTFIQDKELEVFLNHKPYTKTTTLSNVLKLLG